MIRFRWGLRISIFSGAILLLPFTLYAQTPIDCGQILAGSISAAAEKDSYTFTASANDVAALRVRKTSGSLNAYMDLYNPSGGLIQSGNQIDRTLTQAGTYRIDVRDMNNTNMGDYVLYWENLSSPCNVAADLPCDQVVAGSIGTSLDPPPWRIYTFSASANDAVTIRARCTTGGCMYGGCFYTAMTLYGPTGATITTSNVQIDRTLTTTGTYKIIVKDAYNTYAGDYLLTWERFTNPCAPSIDCGQTVINTVGNTASDPPWRFHTITVSSNDTVKIRAIKTSGTLVPYLELYNSAGSLVTGALGEINRTMTAAGTYTVLVRDQNGTNTGSYAITWQRWNNPCAQGISCGQVISGSIGMTADPPPWRYYSFTASTNDSVTIRATKTSGAFTPYLELYDPTGAQIGSGTGQLDKIQTVAGPHTIVVKDQNGVNTGDFILVLQKINDPCNATTIGCGQELMGSIEATGDIDVFTLAGSAGDNIVLTLIRTSGGLDPSLELYNRLGTRLAYQYTSTGNQVVISQSLSSAGTYTVFVSDYGNDETGSYKLKFQKNGGSCPEVTVAAPNGGEKIVARSNFTIRWAATSSLGINSQEIRLSTDGGQAFPTVIASGLSGSLRSYSWDVPADLSASNARIRVTVTDTSDMSTSDDSNADFVVFQGTGRTYVYDELNRLIQVIYEDGRRVTYTYDSLGNRITLTHDE